MSGYPFALYIACWCYRVGLYSNRNHAIQTQLPPGFKILYLRDWSWIGVCCWHQLPRVLSRRAGRSLGLRPRDPGAARQHTGELMSTTNTYPWLIPIITWCRQFPSLSANILLLKIKLKLESRAIAVRVATSPHNLGGKYRCRPHPRSRKCMRQFFRVKQSVLIELHQSGVIAWRQRSRSCGVLKSWISVAHCPFQRKWRVLHNYDISVLEQVGMSFNRITNLMKV